MRQERSQAWGKTKFKPKSFAPRPAPVEEAPLPWNHVKSTIVEDEEDQRSAERFNMNSEQAKEMLKQREQNHRRNVIEEKRNEGTKWESFDDEQPKGRDAKKGKGKHNQTQPTYITPMLKKFNDKRKLNKADKKEVLEQLTFEDRNFMRKKLTRAVLQKKDKGTLTAAIADMARNNVIKPINPNNKFRN
ncbi:uncharacterized protein LOC108608351 [Drosophila busckii]|uniref:uncharacterized protein LOC108608351 n=1 Tax=Drosophila busckii TaxID=30019 RepID=UPI001432E5E9|nr:uncharacterized protein LOC108608351 [Drosophila busckii]